MTSPTPTSGSDAVARMMTTSTVAGAIDLAIGEPDQPLPQELADAAARAFHDGRTGYTPKLGLPELRALIAADTTSSSGRVPVEDVVVTVGGTGAVAVALIVGGTAGVVIPDPAWPNDLVLAEQLGLPVARYRQGPSGDDFFALDEIEQALRAGFRLVVANSPSNPTGAVASAAAMAALVALVERYDARILSDEAYESIVFDGGRAASPLEVGGRDVTFAARTFSKRFSMTGLRLGSLVAPAEARLAVAAVHGTTVGCAPITAQIVGATALERLPDRGTELSAIYRARYENAAAALPGRLASVTPSGLGGFYLWLDVRDTGRSGAALADELAARGVLVSAGTVYSSEDGFLRASLTAPDGALATAWQTIDEVLGAS
ncbi:MULTISPECIES: pyridoxal phosphate-dependent aminotransferase [Microbacterium]|uniref:pyridoxal phosphate-dependent aminotransferase n=1 Tax=Microbacterium TaxID=33882 RepID=UPI001484D608|nr:pyridoxal phosphate-dependent aminotransferase [Microbacterium sp. 4NA327F11]MCK9914874.1 pyridoxal phosphate-dependent aminotransferase [Microbacteriaceae bacterium K1510]